VGSTHFTVDFLSMKNRLISTFKLNFVHWKSTASFSLMAIEFHKKAGRPFMSFDQLTIQQVLITINDLFGINSPMRVNHFQSRRALIITLCGNDFAH